VSEILVDVVDTKTGEIYKYDQLLAAAYLWCAEFGWKVVADDVDVLVVEELPDGSRRRRHRYHRWLYVEPTPGGGRFPVRTAEYWEQTRNWMPPGTCKWKGTVV